MVVLAENNVQGVMGLLTTLGHRARLDKDKVTYISDKEIWSIRVCISLLELDLEQAHEHLAQLLMEKYVERTNLSGQGSSQNSHEENEVPR
ncbi:hypothetical protein EVB68_099 [Rhizobium phage RHph_Y2_6]|uniref:Uncharacterized protein n=1 Tax=Rhizobium phage RHph_Y2_6 TaxID=2509576 RepID=A0A7S5RB93_9CAUD|nr:hypothetical protein PP748_gp097 [Rhizobium phage RHph_Y2_6]QIG68834.1 hypothetical protein EVB68_099 [Rhizobium phage RHph_Y2_6]